MQTCLPVFSESVFVCLCCKACVMPVSPCTSVQEAPGAGLTLTVLLGHQGPCRVRQQNCSYRAVVVQKQPGEHEGRAQRAGVRGRAGAVLRRKPSAVARNCHCCVVSKTLCCFAACGTSRVKLRRRL